MQIIATKSESYSVTLKNSLIFWMKKIYINIVNI